MAVGPHPDDVEIGAGGVLYKTSHQGKKNIIIDLTPSQMSTHGNIQTRLQESQDAAKVLGVHHRSNLMLEDGHICDDCTSRVELAREIRTRKPEILLMPRREDRHPDHECAAELVKNAVFLAWLSKKDIYWLAPHKPRLLLYYMIRQNIDPDLIIPLTEIEYTTKMKAFGSYKSQADTNERGLEYVRSRHIVHGHEIGTQYGEWYKLYSHSVGVQSFDDVMSGFF